jgi:hypothetical protein
MGDSLRTQYRLTFNLEGLPGTALPVQSSITSAFMQ